MPQFKLITPHTSPQNQQYLEAGTIVGDGTPYPWVDSKGRQLPPSLAMTGMDEESQRIIDEHYDEETLNNPDLPKLDRGENTMERATEDMTQNKPNPNVSPSRTPPTAQRNESTVPPLRKGPVGASPSEPAKAPQGGQTGLRNPLDLGQSTDKE